MSIQETQEEIIEEFSAVRRLDAAVRIHDRAREIPPHDCSEEFKTDDNIIKGCQSKVWVHAELN